MIWKVLLFCAALASLVENAHHTKVSGRLYCKDVPLSTKTVQLWKFNDRGSDELLDSAFTNINGSFTLNTTAHGDGDHSYISMGETSKSCKGKYVIQRNWINATDLQIDVCNCDLTLKEPFFTDLSYLMNNVQEKNYHRFEATGHLYCNDISLSAKNVYLLEDAGDIVLASAYTNFDGTFSLKAATYEANPKPMFWLEEVSKSCDRAHYPMNGTIPKTTTLKIDLCKCNEGRATVLTAGEAHKKGSI